MVIKSLAKAASCVMLSLSAAAAEAEITILGPPGHLSCSVSAGMYNTRVIELSAPNQTITGRIRLTAPDPDPRYPPAAGFLWAATVQERPIGIQLSVPPNDLSSIVAVIRDPTRPNRAASDRLSSSDWVSVSVTLHEDGRLEGTVGSTRFEQQMQVRTGLVPFLICNSGTFEFQLDPGVSVSSESIDDRFERQPR